MLDSIPPPMLGQLEEQGKFYGNCNRDTHSQDSKFFRSGPEGRRHDKSREERKEASGSVEEDSSSKGSDDGLIRGLFKHKFDDLDEHPSSD